MKQTFPTTSSVMLHRVDSVNADAHPENSGALSLSFYNDGWETFSFTVFTGDAALSVELAAVINATLAKHGRLNGASDAQSESVG